MIASMDNERMYIIAGVLLFYTSVLLCPSIAQGDSGKFRVTPYCLSADRKLAVRTVFTIHFTFDDEFSDKHGLKKERTERQFWEFECDLVTKECSAFQMGLGEVDQGRPLPFLGTGMVKGMKIVARTGSVFTLRWGEWRTITLDLPKGRVEYRESGPTTEGRGVGFCS